jgi:hypothetical protein
MPKKQRKAPSTTLRHPPQTGNRIDPEKHETSHGANGVKDRGKKEKIVVKTR